MAARPAPLADDLVTRLVAVLGPDHVLTGEADRRFHATDVYKAGALPAAVVRPGSTGEVQAVVRSCAAAGAAVTVRGGGASYTEGYLHDRPGGVTIDSARLNDVVLDEANATVTVGAGVTWAALHARLGERGLRTPFWGPFSGLMATVGGSVSQHSISHGTGVSAESVIGVEVVTGTGEVLTTGATAPATGGSPFFRHFGPDLAGLFCGDCGALGVKTRVTLKLTRRHAAFEAASFSFADFASLHAAMRAVAIEGLDDENYALDATLQQGQLGRAGGAGAKAEIAASVIKSAGSLAGGVKTLARLAVAGDRALKAAGFALHYLADGVDASSARAKISAIRKIAAAHGEEIANTVPIVVRGMPFAPFTNVLGPKGERWVPFHALLAHAAVLPFRRALDAYWEAHRDAMARHGIYSGAMFMSVGSAAFVYEPTFYWPDARSVYHERVVPADHLAGLPVHPAAPEAAALVGRMRAEIIDLMAAHGAAHLQVGKVYPYLASRDAASVAVLRALKAALDPQGIVNPGALGL